jgi:hypothetical protein
MRLPCEFHKGMGAQAAGEAGEETRRAGHNPVTLPRSSNAHGLVVESSHTTLRAIELLATLFGTDSDSMPCVVAISLHIPGGGERGRLRRPGGVGGSDGESVMAGSQIQHRIPE